MDGDSDMDGGSDIGGSEYRNEKAIAEGLYTAPYFPVGLHWSPHGFVK
jgi:hypothetical protein